jgi:hypothetical protein
MKNTSTYVCIKTAFFGWPSTERRWFSSFHNFSSLNHYFRKYFKLMYRKKCGYGNFNHRYNVVLLTSMHFGCGEFYEGGPSVRRPPINWSASDKCLINTALSLPKLTG